MRYAAAILCIWLLAAPARADILPGAGSLSMSGANAGPRGESHAWIAAPLSEPSGSAAIVHLPPRRAVGRTDTVADAEDGAVRLALRLPRMPDRLAAWGNQLWIAFGPEAAGPGKRLRRVLTMSVERGRLAGAWSSVETEGRLPSLPSLPGDDELAGFAGSALGPMALMRSADPTKPGHSLLLLVGSEWTQVPLPQGLSGTQVAGAGKLELVSAPGGATLLLCGGARGAAWQGEFTRSEPRAKASDQPSRALTWSRVELATPDVLGGRAPSPQSPVVMVAGHLVYATRAADGGIEIWAPTPGACHLLNRLTGVGRNYALVPLDQVGRVALVWEEPKPSEPAAATAMPTFKTHVTEVSVFTGQVLYNGPAQVGGPVSAAELKLLALVLVGVMAVVLLVVLRPNEGGHAISLARGLGLAEPGRRIAAGAIDLLGALVCVAVYRHIPVQDLVAPETLFYDPLGVETVLMVLGVGIGHSTLGEWIAGRSIGKLVTRCEVVRIVVVMTGSEAVPGVARPGLWRALVRNVIRWTLPPLAIMGLNGPDHRHRGDLAAGTAVVVRIHDKPASD